MEAYRPTRIGELLVEDSILTDKQVSVILCAQKVSGRPFGYIAEQIYGIDRVQIEDAWARQYLSYQTTINLDDEPVDPNALKLLKAREAWQFHLLPLRLEGEQLIAVTSKQRLTRTSVYIWQRFRWGCHLLVADQPQLSRHIAMHYRWEVAKGVNVKQLARRLSADSKVNQGRRQKAADGATLKPLGNDRMQSTISTH